VLVPVGAKKLCYASSASTALAGISRMQFSALHCMGMYVRQVGEENIDRIGYDIETPCAVNITALFTT
jgi:hypothetical protein